MEKDAEVSKAPKAKKPAGAPSTLALKKEIEEQKATIANLDNQVAAIDGKMDNILNLLNGMTAQDRPTGVPSYNESEDHYQGGGVTPAEFTPGNEIVRPQVMDVESPEFKKKAALLEFESQPVVIRIGAGHSEDDDQVFAIYVNGRAWMFRRDVQYTVPRYVVYGLCQARPMQYRSVEYVDATGGRAVHYPMSRGIRYPFQVVSDPDPRGAAWLQKALAEK